MITQAYFDMKSFYAALDAVRIARKLNWYQVWRETCIHPSVFSKMRKGTYNEPTIQTIATLAVWSELDITTFIHKKEVA